jgi:hypothetical protein
VQEPSVGPEIFPLQVVSRLNDLVENVTRCYELALKVGDRDFTRHVAALGQEYAAQAIELGADPTSLPSPDEWRRLADIGWC